MLLKVHVQIFVGTYVFISLEYISRSEMMNEYIY